MSTVNLPAAPSLHLICRLHTRAKCCVCFSLHSLSATPLDQGDWILDRLYIGRQL